MIAFTLNFCMLETSVCRVERLIVTTAGTVPSAITFNILACVPYSVLMVNISFSEIFFFDLLQLYFSHCCYLF